MLGGPKGPGKCSVYHPGGVGWEGRPQRKAVTWELVSELPKLRAQNSQVVVANPPPPFLHGITRTTLWVMREASLDPGQFPTGQVFRVPAKGESITP